MAVRAHYFRRYSACLVLVLVLILVPVLVLALVLVPVLVLALLLAPVLVLALVLLKFREGHVRLTVTLSSDVRCSAVPNFHFPNSKVCDDFPMYHEHWKPTAVPSLVWISVQFLSKYNGPT